MNAFNFIILTNLKIMLYGFGWDMLRHVPYFLFTKLQKDCNKMKTFELNPFCYSTFVIPFYVYPLQHCHS